MPDDARTNLPPADELFEVRAEIKRLTDREDALKALMHSDPSARTGNNYIAEIKTVTQTRTDLKELRAMHNDIVEQFTFPVNQTRVELRGVSEDGEVFSLRRRTSEAARS